jgi:hypothetical protein
MIGATSRPLHVGLAGTNPDLANEDIFENDLFIASLDAEQAWSNMFM